MRINEFANTSKIEEGPRDKTHLIKRQKAQAYAKQHSRDSEDYQHDSAEDKYQQHKSQQAAVRGAIDYRSDKGLIAKAKAVAKQIAIDKMNKTADAKLISTPGQKIPKTVAKGTGSAGPAGGAKAPVSTVDKPGRIKMKIKKSDLFGKGSSDSTNPSDNTIDWNFGYDDEFGSEPVTGREKILKINKKKTNIPRDDIFKGADLGHKGNWVESKLKELGNESTHTISSRQTLNVQSKGGKERDNYTSHARDYDSKKGLTTHTVAQQFDGSTTDRFVMPGGSGVATDKHGVEKKIQMKGPQSWAYDKPKLNASKKIKEGDMEADQKNPHAQPFLHLPEWKMLHDIDDKIISAYIKHKSMARSAGRGIKKGLKKLSKLGSKNVSTSWDDDGHATTTTTYNETKEQADAYHNEVLQKLIKQLFDVSYDVRYKRGDSDAQADTLDKVMAELKDLRLAFPNKHYKIGEDKNSDTRQKRIAIDTVKNPNKALLGGPSVSEAEDILKTKFGYSDNQIAKLKGVDESKLNEQGVIVPGVNTTVDVKPGQTEIEAAKFGNGKIAPLMPKGKSSSHILFNLGLAEHK